MSSFIVSGYQFRTYIAMIKAQVLRQSVSLSIRYVRDGGHLHESTKAHSSAPHPRMQAIKDPVS